MSLMLVCIKVMTVTGNCINYHENNAPMQSNINGPKFGLFISFERLEVEILPRQVLRRFSFIHPYLFGFKYYSHRLKFWPMHHLLGCEFENTHHCTIIITV